MNCPRCHAGNREGRRFCAECGASLAPACPVCDFVNAPGEKFCGGCGRRLAADTSPSAGSPRSPGLAVPGHLAQRVLTSKSALEGERKQVTVLFADMKGSMELLAERGPEAARAILDPMLELMMEAVHRYEGTVNQVMGDGIMALFGAPLAHEDHAVRACYAALRLQEFAKRHAQGVQRTTGVPVTVRVGLNSGEVVVRSIGSDLRMDYTAVGQTTHLAARMEQMAMPGSILITGQTLALAEGYVRVNPLGAVTVKGLGSPIDVFEVVAGGAVRTRLQAAAARGLTRFVGRDAEVEALRRAVERAGGGRGQVLALVGEPGVGKSRLVREFIDSPRTQDWLVLAAGAVSYGTTTAYLPVIDLLRQYFQIEERDDVRWTREKVTGRLLGLDHALTAALPAILRMLDVPVEEPGWQELAPAQRRQRTHDALRALLHRESLAQPVLVVVEDLHWIDGETQAFLDSLVESLPSARLLLLVNYRPEYEHRWAGKTYYTQLRVDPLPEGSAEELLHALLGGEASLVPLRRRLIERTEGNPFFLEECVRTLVETGALVGTRGTYRAVESIDAVDVPVSVEPVLAARIDRLPQEEKRLLQVAAVIGQLVPYALLQRVAGVPDEELQPALAHLQASEFLYPSGLFPELRYTFKHALTHDVAYGGVLQERRRALHGRVVTELERLLAEQPAEHIDQLAHHALRGEVWDKAVTYLRRAGIRACERSAYREALTCLQQALEALRHLPPGAGTTALAIDLRLDLRTALTPLGHYRRILDLLGEAEALAQELGDDRRLGRVVADRSARLRNVGDHAGALDAGQRACAIAARLGDSDLEVEAAYRLAQVYFALGDVLQSVQLLRQTVKRVHCESQPRTSRLPAYLAAWPHAWLALGLATLGQFPEALVHGAEAVRIAETAAHPHSTIEAQAALGRVHLARGEFAPAIALFERGMAPTRAWNISDSSVFSSLGYAYVLAGRLGEGLPLLEEAVERGQSIDALGIGSAARLTRLGEGYLLAGHPNAAQACTEQALAVSRAQKERANEAVAVRLLGAIAASRAPVDTEAAMGHHRRALALADELSLRPLAAHCHAGLASVARHTGNDQRAAEHLAVAARMYREMGMVYWLGKLEEPSSSLGLPQ